VLNGTATLQHLEFYANLSLVRSTLARWLGGGSQSSEGGGAAELEPWVGPEAGRVRKPRALGDDSRASDIRVTGRWGPGEPGLRAWQRAEAT
jgi:hypothetical protein